MERTSALCFLCVQESVKTIDFKSTFIAYGNPGLPASRFQTSAQNTTESESVRHNLKPKGKQ